MKDFRFRNDTDLYFLNDPKEKLSEITGSKRVLFVYGGGSVKKNGCYDDIKEAVEKSGGIFLEYGGCSREYEAIEAGIEQALDQQAEIVIGAGGASVMDAAKLIAFGVKHRNNLWDYISGEKESLS